MNGNYTRKLGFKNIMIIFIINAMVFLSQVSASGQVVKKRKGHFGTKECSKPRKIRLNSDDIQKFGEVDSVERVKQWLDTNISEQGGDGQNKDEEHNIEEDDHNLSESGESCKSSGTCWDEEDLCSSDSYRSNGCVSDISQAYDSTKRCICGRKVVKAWVDADRVFSGCDWSEHACYGKCKSPQSISEKSDSMESERSGDNSGTKSSERKSYDDMSSEEARYLGLDQSTGHPVSESSQV